jgi:hypothetical protein
MGAAMRSELNDEYARATYLVLVGGGTPFFTALDSWVNLDLVETRTFPGGVVLTRYKARRSSRQKIACRPGASDNFVLLAIDRRQAENVDPATWSRSTAANAVGRPMNPP